jgi:hypothetical protein
MENASATRAAGEREQLMAGRYDQMRDAVIAGRLRH